MWALHLCLCHHVQSGTRDCSVTSYLSPLAFTKAAEQPELSPQPQLPEGSLCHYPPHQQPTRYAKSISSTEIRKMCQKKLPCLSPAQWTQQIFAGFEALKGVLCVLVLLEPPTKEMKRRNKTSEQPNLVWTACIHYSKDRFLLVPPPYPPPQWWQREAWHSSYRIFILNREGQLVGGRHLGYGIQGSMQPAETTLMAQLLTMLCYRLSSEPSVLPMT